MNPMKEPSADQRAAARDMFGLYNALRLEGFTEYQACTMLGQMLGTVMKGSATDGD